MLDIPRHVQQMSWPNVFDEPLRIGGVHQVSRVYFAAFKNDRPDVDGMHFIAAFKKYGAACRPMKPPAPVKSNRFVIEPTG